MLHRDNRWSERQVGITLDFGLIHFAFSFAVDQRSEIRDQNQRYKVTHTNIFRRKHSF